MSHKPFRVAVFLSRLSGYMSTCLKQLKEAYGAQVLVIRWPPAAEAPFDARRFAWIDVLKDRTSLSVRDMERLVEDFGPTAVLMSGWADRGYLQVAKGLRHRGVPVVAGMDTQPNGSFRQYLAQRVSRFHLHPSIDVLWVAGERQRQLAYRFGYRGARCWSGVYACD